MKNHVLSAIKPKSKGFNEEEAVQLCQDYLVNTLAAQKCTYNYVEQKCQCLAFLKEEGNGEDARNIAASMVHWAAFNTLMKREVLHQWSQFASYLDKTKKSKRYILPFKTSEGEGVAENKPLICRATLCSILNVGPSLLKSATSSPKRVHGNSGKRGPNSPKGKSFAEVYLSLEAFFCAIKRRRTSFCNSGNKRRDGNEIAG